MNKEYVMLKVDEIEKLLLEHNIDKADELFKYLISYIEKHKKMDWKNSLIQIYQKMRIGIITEINM